MKLEIDRAYDWLVVVILVTLVLFLVGWKYEPAVVKYFTPDSIRIDSPPPAEGFVPPAE